MRLLTQNRKPVLRQEITPNRQELEKAIFKEKEVERKKALEYQDELQGKLETLQKVETSFLTDSKKVEAYLSELGKVTRETIEKATSLADDLDKQIAPLKETVAGQKEELESIAEQAKESIASLTVQKDTLDQSLNQIAERITDLADSEHLSQQAKTELEKQKAEAQEVLKATQEVLFDLGQRRQEIEEIITSGKASFAEQKKELEVEKIRIDSTQGYFTGLETKLTDWQEQLEEKEKRIIPNAEEKIEKLHEQKKGIEEGVAVLEKKFNGLSDLKEVLFGVHTQLLAEKAKVEISKKEARESTATFQQLAKETEETAKKKQAEILVANRSIANENAEIQQAQESIKGIEGKFSQLNKSLNEKIALVEQKKEEGKTLLEDLEEQAKEVVSSVEEAKTGFDSYKQEVEIASQTLAKLSGNAQSTKTEAEFAGQSVRNIAHEAKDILKQAKEKLETIQQIVELNNLQVASMEKTAEKTEQRFKEWEKRLADRELVLRTAFQEAQRKQII